MTWHPDLGRVQSFRCSGLVENLSDEVVDGAVRNLVAIAVIEERSHLGDDLDSLLRLRLGRRLDHLGSVDPRLPVG